MLVVDDQVAAMLSSAATESRLLMRLARSRDAKVRLQFAVALCELGVFNDRWLFEQPHHMSGNPKEALLSLWRSDSGSAWLRKAMLSPRDSDFEAQAGPLQSEFLKLLCFQLRWHRGSLNSEQLAFLEELSAHAAERLPARVEQAIRILDTAPSRDSAIAILYGAGVVAKRGNPPTRQFDPAVPSDDALHALHRGNVIDSAIVTCLNPEASVEVRSRAIRLVGLLAYADAAPVLNRLLDSEQPVDIHIAAIRAFSSFNETVLVGSLLERWAQATPAVRRAILDVVLSRREFAEFIIAALEDEVLSSADFDNVNTERLKRLCTAAQLPRIEKIFSRRTDANRAQVVNDHQSVLMLTGDSEQGAKLFVQNCRTCHAIQGQGNRIGPDLASVARRPPADILTEILDPSRNVAPDGMNYVVGVKDGRVLAGLLAGENSESITLRRADGEDSIPRSDIEELRNTGRSLMPEGFEKNLSPQDFANLLAFLKKGEPPKP
jgi:putative heme-binding domain-containing protein